MSNAVCKGDGCNQLTVAKCMHCDNHLCLKCLTRHQQPIDAQICQLTNDINKLLSLSLLNDDDNNIKQSNHPQINARKQYVLVMEQINLWEMTMTKKLNDLILRARQSLRNSFEQLSFEIEEWSTERQIDIQQLATNIGKILYNKVRLFYFSVL